METNELMNAFIDVYFKTMKDLNLTLQASMATYQVSFEQYQILRDIATNRVSNLTDIVRLRGVTKPAIARQLRTLRNLDYISQTTAENDRRRHILKLTTVGARIEREITATVSEFFEQFVDAVGADKVETLRQLLATIDADYLEPAKLNDQQK
ncbi:MarR family winged helix-turn-helix transcriptional regulator [Lacticaseibacillus hulanensis]|jgi:DNA-binding MarR family transcriptional regulator|uniref:MarR family winged helix-turn-helix transcriptional regulator n=1 Tax=Lacticaseibacillus hulanensis TaxID=2493111 RepID=UPI000FDABE2F|nr:MarR family winged helix-turn-helix transcriptional regulator [Lacticaseibacillus hulanensis]